MSFFVFPEKKINMSNLLKIEAGLTLSIHQLKISSFGDLKSIDIILLFKNVDVRI